MLNAWCSDEYSSYIGVEPIGKAYRTTVHKKINNKGGKYRFGVLMDTGAPESAVGKLTLTRYVDTFGLSQFIEREPFQASLSGIGAGTAEVNHRAKVAVGFEKTSGKFFDAYYQAQVLEGVGERIPALYGLSKKIEYEGRFDLRKRADGSFTYATTAGEFKLHLIHGHLILPADWGGNPMPELDVFINDPLGLEVFYTNEPADEHRLENPSKIEQHSPPPKAVPSAAHRVVNISTPIGG